jgi:hypothetical protein
MLLYAGSPRKDQPVVLNATGTVCETWHKELVETALKLAAWVTRTDFAVDVHPPDLARQRLGQMRREFRGGRAITMMRHDSCEFTRSDGETGGDTLYLGGKYAEQRLRAYDVRGPLRLEWQWRPKGKDAGRAVPHMLAHHGVLPMWRGLCQAKLTFKLPWFKEVAEGSAVELVAPLREDVLLLEAIEHLQFQFGPSLWAMKLVGITLEDLAVKPDNLKSTLRAKLLRWADEADKLGRDGSKLRQELKCKRK